jgi:hypothetical protein
MAYEMIWFALVVLLTPVFAEYAKIRGRAERGFMYIGTAGVLFLVAMSFEMEFWYVFAGSNAIYGVYLFQVFGWLVLIIGAAWVATKMLPK